VPQTGPAIGGVGGGAGADSRRGHVARRKPNSRIVSVRGPFADPGLDPWLHAAADLGPDIETNINANIRTEAQPHSDATAAATANPKPDSEPMPWEHEHAGALPLLAVHPPQRRECHDIRLELHAEQ
jgi:hypothetical protein